MKIIDGKKIAYKIEEEVKSSLRKLKKVPQLAIILIGKNPASEIYVQKKEEVCQRLKIGCQIYRLPASIGQDKILKLIEKLNKDKKVHGILVQLPLPLKINRRAILSSIAPWKDVDGLNPIIKTSRSSTASAVIEAIKYTGVKLKTKHVVLVGYSDLVGKPLISFLVEQGATVTICHKETKNLTFYTKQADILIVAAAKPKLIKVSMVKRGVIIIDVGVNQKGKKIIGDVDFENVKKKASFISPVPGGIGPITVIKLLENILNCVKIK